MKLEDIEKENSFELPEDYFNQLESSVMHTVHRRHLWSRIAKIGTPSLVAVFLGLLAFNLWFTNPEQETTSPTLAENVSNSDAVYLAENTLEISDLVSDDESADLTIDVSDLDNSDYLIIAYYGSEQASLDFLY